MYLQADDCWFLRIECRGPVNPNNARDLCITAAAGTELAVSSSCGTIIPRQYYCPGHLSHMTGVYNPKTFILHATSHRQAFAHCE